MSEQHSKEIRSIVTSEGNVELSIAISEIPVPSDDEVLIKVGASPINPSDLALLLSFAADMDTITSTGSGDDTVTTIKIHPAMMGAMKPRLDESMQVGNEGSGVVVDAGTNAKDLIGKTVGLAGGAMYSQYRCVPAISCLVMEDGTLAAEAASSFVNPLTALAAISIADSIWPGNSPLLPPPVASKPKVAPVSINAFTRSFMKSGSLVLHTCSAPKLFKSSTCSGFLTMFTKGTESSLHIFTNI